MALKRINGIVRYFPTEKLEIKNVSNGRWEVTYDRGTFLVVGGTKSGGGKREWFLHYPDFYGDVWLPTKSMAESLRLGITY